MTDAIPVRLAFLANPDRGVIVLNVQVGEDLKRFQLSRDQIFQINKDSADFILRNFK